MILIGCAKSKEFLKEISSSIRSAFPNSEYHDFLNESECISYAKEFIGSLTVE